MKKILILFTLISSFAISQNRIQQKMFGVGMSRMYTTALSSTVNGSVWYDGGIGGLNGFNFYSNDPSNASFLFSVSNSTNYLKYYADHANNNWIAVRPGSSMMFSTDNASTVSYEIDQSAHVWTVHTATAPIGTTAIYRWASASHTGQTASTELSPFVMSPFGVTYNTGALPRQRAMNFGQMTIGFNGVSTLIDGANFYIAGGLIAGSNASITNNSALMIGGMTGTSSIGGGSTNGYGLTVYAPTGATNNFAARFLQGFVGMGVSTPSFALDILNTSPQLRLSYDAANAFSVTVASNNNTTFALKSSAQFIFSNNVSMDGFGISSGTGTGVKIAMGTTEKLGFYGVSPVTQRTATSELGTVLSDLGLRATGGTYPITTTGAVSFSNVTSSGSITSTSKTGGIGYAVGSGSTITQATSRTTGVTINAVTGSITLVSAAGSALYQTFTVTNSAVTAKDVIVVNQQTGTDLNIILVTNVAAGSFKISFATTGGVTVEQPVFNFAVIKGQTN